MHIILGVLGSIITILYLLSRIRDSGLDIGWLNPFAWKRRRDWAKRYHANPLYNIDSPMEATALIIVLLVKTEGEMSRNQKQEVINLFQDDFKLSEKGAADLLASCVYLITQQGHQYTDIDIKKLLAPSSDKFSPSQIESALKLFEHISSLEAEINNYQKQIINTFKKQFQNKLEQQTWH
ncbi:MAG: hypothetical protein OEY96_06535 [Gammaproteobacteria bacterium]|nr:hypothetical protein [Gammaproteobacteria bacterium]